MCNYFLSKVIKCMGKGENYVFHHLEMLSLADLNQCWLPKILGENFQFQSCIKTVVKEVEDPHLLTYKNLTHLTSVILKYNTSLLRMNDLSFIYNSGKYSCVLLDKNLFHTSIWKCTTCILELISSRNTFLWAFSHNLCMTSFLNCDGNRFHLFWILGTHRRASEEYAFEMANEKAMF